MKRKSLLVGLFCFLECERIWWTREMRERVRVGEKEGEGEKDTERMWVKERAREREREREVRFQVKANSWPECLLFCLSMMNWTVIRGMIPREFFPSLGNVDCSNDDDGDNDDDDASKSETSNLKWTHLFASSSFEQKWNSTYVWKLWLTSNWPAARVGGWQPCK